MTLLPVVDVELPAADSVATDETTTRFIEWSLERFRQLRLVMTTSFGMEGCALIDLVGSLRKPMTVYCVDTGFLFPETLALKQRMIARYPHLTFVSRHPDLTPERQVNLFGDELWRGDPDLCCHLRKVVPMRAVLRDADVWITGVTRAQSPSRASTRLIEWDWQFQLIKVNPLVNWTREQVWEYVRRRDVPYNALHEQGYASIGCTHCTRPVPGLGLGEYSRQGRWSGSGKTECGLHRSAESRGG